MASHAAPIAMHHFRIVVHSVLPNGLESQRMPERDINPLRDRLSPATSPVLVSGQRYSPIGGVAIV